MSAAPRPLRGFWPELALGLAMSLAAAAVFHVLRPVLGAADALRLVLLGSTAGYGLWLMQASAARVGRVVSALAFAALALTLIGWNPGIGTWLIGLPAFVWLLRSLYRHDSVLAAVADGELTLLALAVGIASLQHTHSLWLGLWCFFLTQSLHHLIPSGWGARPVPTPAEHPASFDQAYRASEAAFSRLASRG